MAIGMGSPLLLVGVAGGRFLPHAGAWMTTVKTLFGVLFLAGHETSASALTWVFYLLATQPALVARLAIVSNA